MRADAQLHTNCYSLFSTVVAPLEAAAGLICSPHGILCGICELSPIEQQEVLRLNIPVGLKTKTRQDERLKKLGIQTGYLPVLALEAERNQVHQENGGFRFF